MYSPLSMVLDVSLLNELYLLSDPAAESIALLLTKKVYSVSAVSILIDIECFLPPTVAPDGVTSAEMKDTLNVIYDPLKILVEGRPMLTVAIQVVTNW